jgi:hypothetical protein
VAAQPEGRATIPLHTNAGNNALAIKTTDAALQTPGDKMG